MPPNLNPNNPLTYPKYHLAQTIRPSYVVGLPEGAIDLMFTAWISPPDSNSPIIRTQNGRVVPTAIVTISGIYAMYSRTRSLNEPLIYLIYSLYNPCSIYFRMAAIPKTTPFPAVRSQNMALILPAIPAIWPTIALTWPYVSLIWPDTAFIWPFFLQFGLLYPL